MIRQEAAHIGVPYRSPLSGRGVPAIVSGASAAAVLLLFSASVMADPESPSESVQQHVSNPENAEFETVTVEARRKRRLLNDQINMFVSSITMPAKHESLARWQVPICLLVAGLSRAGGEFVMERVSQVARDAGVPMAPKECAPNFAVVVTPEPEELLRQWWAEDHRLFNRDRGVGGVERLIQTAQPVRVWHNACSVSPSLARSFQMKGGPLCSTGELGSRLTWEAVRVIYSVIVVVDFKYIEGLSYGQVADYVAMNGLAQIRKNPELNAAPTILRLFAETEAARPQGLSSWDQSFLKSLYETTSGNVTQLSEIKLRMGQDLAP